MSRTKNRKVLNASKKKTKRRENEKWREEQGIVWERGGGALDGRPGEGRPNGCETAGRPARRLPTARLANL